MNNLKNIALTIFVLVSFSLAGEKQYHGFFLNKASCEQAGALLTKIKGWHCQKSAGKVGFYCTFT